MFDGCMDDDPLGFAVLWMLGSGEGNLNALPLLHDLKVPWFSWFPHLPSPTRGPL